MYVETEVKCDDMLIVLHYSMWQGVKIKMDDAGNILIKRVSKCNVYVKNTGQDDENAIGNEILKLPGCALEPEKPVKVSHWRFNKLEKLVIMLDYYVTVVRHEKVPVERESGITSRISGQTSSGMSMFECHCLCKIGTGCTGVSHLGSYNQCSRNGYAQIQITTR